MWCRLPGRKKDLMAEGERTKVAFIVSTNRAGSTWLSLVLGSHAWASYVGEYSRYWENSNLKCNLCVSRGKEDCELFEGVRAIAPEAAHRFAQACTNASVIVDASKTSSWARQSARNGNIDARLIFLYCHPCKYVASVIRRDENSIDGAFSDWKNQNKKLLSFVKKSPLPAIAVNYEQLAANPERDFPGICKFLWGNDFEKEALIYWQYEHHGLGGTGANSMYLKKYERGLYITNDDNWYNSLYDNPLQVDERWKTELDEKTQNKILADRASKAFLNPEIHLKVYNTETLYASLRNSFKRLFF